MLATTPDFLDLPPRSSLVLELPGKIPCAHVFDRKMICAVNTALAAGRPLLVRGEPGTGKTQFARATAKALGRAFVSHVLDVHSEPRDLFWWLDAVERLAEAQLVGATGRLEEKLNQNEKKSADGEAGDSPSRPSTESKAKVLAREQLALERFVQPGPLWWAFDWKDAEKQAKSAQCQPPPATDDGGDPANGCVLLLDEIDKADTSVPNGLLEALGHGSFSTPFGRVDMVKSPLVIITTNEERELPDAFLRRCLVLHLELLPDRADLIDWMVERGQYHFGKHAKGLKGEPRERQISEKVLRRVATDLVDERLKLLARHLTAPGQAEYLDILRALDEITRRRGVVPAKVEEAQLKLLDEVKQFALEKHPPKRRGSS